MTTNPAPRVQYLDVADYLLIAEPVVGLDAEALLDEADIELAELALHAPAAASSGVEFYADLVTKAAVLCVRLIQFRTLPNGNNFQYVEPWERSPAAFAPTLQLAGAYDLRVGNRQEVPSWHYLPLSGVPHTVDIL